MTQKQSFRARHAAQGEGGSTIESRRVRAIWAEGKAARVVRELQTWFRAYPRDKRAKMFVLDDFEVCPLAGESSRSRAVRRSFSDADDLVLIFSRDLLGVAHAIDDLYAFYDGTARIQADAPTFWLGAAHSVTNLDLLYIGEVRVKDFPWQLLHPNPPGRFSVGEDNDDRFADEIEMAVVKIAEYEKNRAGTDDGSDERQGARQQEGGFLSRLAGWFGAAKTNGAARTHRAGMRP